jgi:hypothetical protein
VTKAVAILALGGAIAWSLSHLPIQLLAQIARAL